MSRFERGTCLSCSENHIFPLHSSTNTKKGTGSAQKIGNVGLVETNNFFTPYVVQRYITMFVYRVRIIPTRSVSNVYRIGC